LKSKIIFLFIFGGILSLGVYGYANTLTITGINEIQTLQIVSSHPESLLFLNLGTDADITEIEIKFVNDGFWEGRTVTVNIYDMNEILIGTGSVVASSENPKVTLSNTVTSTERPDLRKITVTAT